MAGPGHNSGEAIGGIAAEALRQFVERIERLQEEKKALQQDIAEVYAEAKSTGFDKKALRKLVAERAREPQQLAEENEILDLYRAAVGGTGVFAGGAE